MEPPLQRKPKLYFETVANPSHVTFDDGKEERRNLSWLHYDVARWLYAEPDMIRLEIGDCVVVLHGHNLVPLFRAIEERTLLRVCAQLEFTGDRERERDSFVTEIKFSQLPVSATAKRRAPTQLDLLE